METRKFPLGEGREIRLEWGDCIEVVNRLPEASVDVVVTSPPYNIGTPYATYQDTLPMARYLEWSGHWMRAVSRVLSPEGSLFLQVGSTPREPWQAFEIAQVARRMFQLQNTIHWIKAISLDINIGAPINDRITESYGHYKPINSPRFVNDCHEFIFHFSKTGAVPLDRKAVGVPYKDGSNALRWSDGGDGMRCRGNAWFLPYETIRSRAKDRPHPATFPVKLPEWCLRLHGLDRIRGVLDPFLGLGSTAVACAGLGLPCIGIDLDRDYLAVAAERVGAVIAPVYS